MAPLPRLAAVAVATLAGLFAALGLGAPAHAEDGFRFWGYYHLEDGDWVASTKGADTYKAEDGDVEGFRYATTTQSTFNRPPRATPSFADICAGTEAGQGDKRIGIVLDFGTAQDAAEGDNPLPAEAVCAVVPSEASTQQALESVQPLRIEGGLICAIDGYPASGCAEEVANASVPKNEEPVDVALPSESQAEPAESSMPWPLVGVGAGVLVLGGGAFLVARRRGA